MLAKVAKSEKARAEIRMPMRIRWPVVLEFLWLLQLSCETTFSLANIFL